MLDPLQLLIAAILPVVIVCAALVFLRGTDWSFRLEVAAPTALAITLVGFRFLEEWNSPGDSSQTLFSILTQLASRFLPPKEARDWLVAALLVAGLVVILEHGWKFPRWLNGLWGGLLSLTLYRFLSGSIYFERWSVMMVAGTLIGAGLALSGMASWLQLQDGGQNVWVRVQRFLFVFIAGTASIVALTSASISTGVLGFGLTSTFLCVAIADLWRPSNAPARLSGGLFPFCFAAWGAIGYFFAEISTWNLGLLLAALGVTGLLGIKLRQASHQKTLAIFGVVLCLVLSCAAVGFSVRQFLLQMQQQTDNPYSSMK